MITAGYLHIERMRIDNANGESNQYVCGLPSLTSVCGLGHAFERFCRESRNLDLVVDGVAVIIHSAEMYPGTPRTPVDECGAKQVNKNSSTVEEIKMGMEVSLILKIRCDEENEDLIHSEISSGYSWVFDWVSVSRLAGGSCANLGGVSFFVSKDSLDSALEKSKRGYFVVHRSDLLECIEGDALDHVLHAMSLSKIEESEDLSHRTGSAKIWRRNQAGWIVPVSIGYQAIERPTTGRSTRQDLDHVFAEPVTSLAEMVSVKKLLSDDDIHKKIFWFHRCDRDQGLYYVDNV